MPAPESEQADGDEERDQPLVGSGAILARLSLILPLGSLLFLGLAAFVALSDLHRGWLADVTQGGGVSLARQLARRLLQAFLALCLWGVGCGVFSLILPHGDVDRRRAGIGGLLLGTLLPLLAWLLTVISVRAILARHATGQY